MISKLKEILPIIIYVYLFIVMLSCIIFIEYVARYHFTYGIQQGLSMLSLHFSITLIFYIRKNLLARLKDKQYFKLICGIISPAVCGYILFDLSMIFFLHQGTIDISSIGNVDEVIKNTFIHAALMFYLAVITFASYKWLPKMRFRNSKNEI